MKIKDTFEIKEDYHMGHASGLVVVLDTLLTRDPYWLVSGRALICTPSGEKLDLPIDEAKEHGPVNSLFFRRLTRDDVPVGSEITITILMAGEAEPKESALAS